MSPFLLVCYTFSPYFLFSSLSLSLYIPLFPCPFLVSKQLRRASLSLSPSLLLHLVSSHFFLSYGSICICLLSFLFVILSFLSFAFFSIISLSFYSYCLLFLFLSILFCLISCCALVFFFFYFLSPF
jgi:hypothetical protein